MQTFYATIAARNVFAFAAKFGQGELIHTLPPSPLVGHRCCGEPVEHLRSEAYIVRVQAVSRNALKRSSLVLKTRVKPPKAGWASLEGATHYTEC